PAHAPGPPRGRRGARRRGGGPARCPQHRPRGRLRHPAREHRGRRARPPGGPRLRRGSAPRGGAQPDRRRPRRRRPPGPGPGRRTAPALRDLPAAPSPRRAHRGDPGPDLPSGGPAGARPRPPRPGGPASGDRRDVRDADRPAGRPGTVTAAVAIVAAGLAAWVLCGPPPELVRLRELTAPPATPRWRRSMARAAVRLRRVARPGRAGRDADAWRKTCLELCQALMAELTAGRSAEDALCRAVAAVEPPDPAVVRPVAAAARDGGDVPAALAEAARAPGAEGLRRLAACWRVSTAVGGSLTVLVEGVITALREAEAHRRDLTAQLAGPRATVRLLAL